MFCIFILVRVIFFYPNYICGLWYNFYHNLWWSNMVCLPDHIFLKLIHWLNDIGQSNWLAEVGNLIWFVEKMMKLKLKLIGAILKSPSSECESCWSRIRKQETSYMWKSISQSYACFSSFFPISFANFPSNFHPNLTKFNKPVCPCMGNVHYSQNCSLYMLY
jgi:hypothetical protein